MRYLLILTAALLLGACAPDDRVFDVSALSPEHQADVQAAMDDLNLRYGFVIDNDRAVSRMVYGRPEPGASATTYDLFFRSFMGWKIVFVPEWASQDKRRLTVTTHELCHVLGIAHDEGNPDPDSC